MFSRPRKPREWITTPAEIAAMRHAGQLVARAHQAVKAAIAPGISTRELDAIAESVIRDGGGTPAFKGYRGTFPGTICASPNEVIVHGFPNRRRLQTGDIIGIDIGAVFEGHYGDAAWTHPVGEVALEARRLIEATAAALEAAIALCHPGTTVAALSAAIAAIGQAGGYGIVHEYCGHGIGRVLHGWPQIPNLPGDGPSPTLQAGQAIAIEPMFTLGTGDTRVKADDWTVVTTDGSLSAHCEHTVWITADGPQVLTALSSDIPQPLSV
jgi:methionyl aminopeptidase